MTNKIVFVLTGFLTSTALGGIIYNKWWCNLTQTAKSNMQYKFIQGLTLMTSMPLIYLIAMGGREIQTQNIQTQKPSQHDSLAIIDVQRAADNPPGKDTI